MNDLELTPLMRQYRDIKQTHQDAILFFRVGDFYEMFYEDAEEASKILNIALTSRDKNKSNPVPLCGVPYHAAQGYIAKLLQAGKTVALCEQVEDPKQAKGLVRREVVRVYTPGTLTDSELLASTQSCFLSAIAESLNSKGTGDLGVVMGLAVLELSTGEFWVQEFSGQNALLELEDELVKLEPRELLYPHPCDPTLQPLFSTLKGIRLCAKDPYFFDLKKAKNLLETHFAVTSLESFGCEDLTAGLQAAGAILQYVKETQPGSSQEHLHRLSIHRGEQEMYLDSVTVRNLELISPLVDHPTPNGRNENTLFGVLNLTSTVMGSRLLREWIVRPLLNLDRIQARLNAVEELVVTIHVRGNLRVALKKIQDILRLSTRISIGAANPRELLALQDSIAILPDIETVLSSLHSPMFREFLNQWDSLTDLSTCIQDAIMPDAPVSTREGRIIKNGFDTQLDEYRSTCRDGKGQMTQLEAQERADTGIESLKVRFNQVFGYYIEVTKANLNRVPDRFIRKQTLANAERFTTSELKTLEELVTHADRRLIQLEQELFEQVRHQLAQHTARVQGMGRVLASLDVLAALAEAAARYHYVKPDIHPGGELAITEGRHPVVERLMGREGGFIPNSTLLNLEDQRLLIITGPNMAGKSTYLRQVGHIALMTHMGSFVPATAARLGLVDRVFTRVGASDNLAAGQSTFMVEMTETAKILHCATSRSLILLDEIGRGTSTYDGLSLAWAIAEYIQDRNHLGARTLFATHYHEMTELAQLREGIKNYTVAVRERNGELLFLRKIIEGAADRSYGIHVAKLAGLPSAVISRAQDVLFQLEQPSNTIPHAHVQEEPFAQLTLQETNPHPHPIIEEVRQIDLFTMTPLEALNKLADLQRQLDP